MTRLRELRLQAGLNMAETAKLFKIPYTTYVSYDNGTYEPSLDMLIGFANHYGVSVDYLIGKTDDPRTRQQKQQAEAELQEYLELLRTRPEMKVLLDTVKDATKEEVEANVQFIEALRKSRQD